MAQQGVQAELAPQLGQLLAVLHSGLFSTAPWLVSPTPLALKTAPGLHLPRVIVGSKIGPCVKIRTNTIY